MAKKKEKTLEEKLQEALVPENQWPYILPENWCWTRLENVANWGSGGTPSRKHPEYYQGNIPWIKTGELKDDFIYDAEEHISEEAISKSNAKLFPVNTVVLAMYGATIGKAGIMGCELATNQACACGVSNESINYRFLFEYIKSQKDGFIASGKGGAQPNISQQIIKSYPIPLPPLPEQKRIVHRIESLFAKLDEAKEKIQQVLDGAEMRKAAILHKAFTGELTKTWRKENGISEDSWESVKLKELGEFNRGKSKHRPRNDPRLFNGPYPFIQTGDVSSSGMYIQKHSQTLSEFGMQQSRLFPKDTLCITIAANIGKVAILTYDCCFPDSVVGFTPNERTFSKYMYYSMLKIQKEIEALAPAVAQKNLSLKLLLDVNVQIPSVEEQHTIVKIIERLLKHEKNVISSSMRSIESIETMKKSILAKAFRGELGTNNPTEYSALNLLKEVLQDKS